MTRLSLRALGAFALLAFALPALAQSPVGTWRTIDDETGEPRSLVRIVERDGKLYGFVQEVLSGPNRCADCAGRYKNQNLRGVQILSGFSRDGGTWEDGQITDPRRDKTYKAKMEVLRDGRLKVWGYLGVDTPLTRREQFWERVR